MCIRDSDPQFVQRFRDEARAAASVRQGNVVDIYDFGQEQGCLLYTSDAADERSSVDLGGRRIIKKKNTYNRHGLRHTTQAYSQLHSARDTVRRISDRIP